MSEEGEDVEKAMNATSRWQEHIEIDGLTLYDIHRRPRAQIEAGEVVQRSADSVKPYLQCPICLGIMHDPVIVMECLHRFCNSCIQKCLRIGKNECPCCKIHIPSRRSLRSDDNFKRLISKLFPSLEAYEEKEQRHTELLNRSRMSHGFGAVAEKLLSTQKMRRTTLHRRVGRVARSPEASKVGGKARGEGQAHGQGPSGKQGLAGTITFILVKHPHERNLQVLPRQYLRSSSRLLVRHVKKFVGVKLKLSEYERLEIVVRARDKAVVLDETFSLSDIHQHFWQQPSDLVLHYRLPSLSL